MIFIIALIITLVMLYLKIELPIYLIVIWCIAFAIDAIYTYINRAYIKSKEFNIIMRGLYQRLNYSLIILIVLAIEVAMIFAIAYLTNGKITTIMIAFTILHLEAFYNSRRTIKNIK
ncbi:MAG: hypothetical protein QW416_08645 [Candidatus Nitrosocaldaceae archaeon]